MLHSIIEQCTDCQWFFLSDWEKYMASGWHSTYQWPLFSCCQMQDPRICACYYQIQCELNEEHNTGKWLAPAFLLLIIFCYEPHVVFGVSAWGSSVYFHTFMNSGAYKQLVFVHSATWKFHTWPLGVKKCRRGHWPHYATMVLWRACTFAPNA